MSQAAPAPVTPSAAEETMHVFVVPWFRYESWLKINGTPTGISVHKMPSDLKIFRSNYEESLAQSHIDALTRLANDPDTPATIKESMLKDAAEMEARMRSKNFPRSPDEFPIPNMALVQTVEISQTSTVAHQLSDISSFTCFGVMLEKTALETVLANEFMQPCPSCPTTNPRSIAAPTAEA